MQMKILTTNEVNKLKNAFNNAVNAVARAFAPNYNYFVA